MVVTQANQPIIKMYAIFARETVRQMKGNEGKLAAQAGHAYLHAWWDAESRFGGEIFTTEEAIYQRIMQDYKYDNDARKIALITETVDDLEMLYERYRPYMGATLVEDCAYTVFEGPTITCCGLGPVAETWFNENDDYLKKLDLLRHEL